MRDRVPFPALALLTLTAGVAACSAGQADVTGPSPVVTPSRSSTAPTRLPSVAPARAAALTPGPSSEITWEFAGTDTLGGSGSCVVSVAFDPNALDSDPDPNSGLYHMGAPYGFDVTIEGQVIFSARNGLTIEVLNDVSELDATPRDEFDVEPVQPSGSDLHFNTNTRTLSAFANDRLPATPPVGNGFSGVFEGDHQGRSYFCTFN